MVKASQVGEIRLLAVDNAVGKLKEREAENLDEVRTFLLSLISRDFHEGTILWMTEVIEEHPNWSVKEAIEHFSALDDDRKER